jgi:hypothetical protein
MLWMCFMSSVREVLKTSFSDVHAQLPLTYHQYKVFNAHGAKRQGTGHLRFPFHPARHVGFERREKMSGWA